jgi:hypothetical protein
MATITGKREQSGERERAKAGNSLGLSTRNKRTDVQREADLALISHLLVRENLNHHEIAERIAKERSYSISNVQVGYDVKELYKRWREAYLDDIDTLKGREIRRIDELETAYWDSYSRSLGSTSSYREEVIEMMTTDKLEVEGEQEESPKKRTLRSRKFQDVRDGEVKFLNGIQWCINKRCEILGLNAPLKSEMTFDWRTEAEKQGIDPGIMFNELVKRFVDGNIIEGETKELNG